MVDFVILTTQRCGSTYLKTLLNNHPTIECYGELFQKNKKKKEVISYWEYIKENKRVSPYLLQFSLKALENYFQTVFNCRAPSAQLIGCKLMVNQLQINKKITRYLHKQRSKIISIIRKNVLDVCISRFFARKTGVYTSKKEYGKPLSSVTIEKEWINREAKKIIDDYEYICRLQKEFNHISISYEDITTNKQEVLKAVQHFLDIQYYDLYSDLNKLITYKKKLVKNYDELEDYLNKNNKLFFYIENENKAGTK